jgi:hypothetical protein
MASLIPEANLFGATWTSRAWPAVNYGIFVPFSLEEQIDARWISNLTPTTAGQWDYGVYSIRGSALSLVTSFGTGLTGNNGVSMSNVSFFLNPGYYFMAMSCNTTSGSHFAANPAAELLEAHGVRGSSSAFPLPSSPSFDAHPQAFLPSFAMHFAAT